MHSPEGNGPPRNLPLAKTSVCLCIRQVSYFCFNYTGLFFVEDDNKTGDTLALAFQCEFVSIQLNTSNTDNRVYMNPTSNIFN